MDCHEHNKLDPNDTVSISGQPTCQDDLSLHDICINIIFFRQTGFLSSLDQTWHEMLSSRTVFASVTRLAASRLIGPPYLGSRPIDPQSTFGNSVFLLLVCGRCGGYYARGFGCGEVLDPRPPTRGCRSSPRLLQGTLPCPR